MAAALSRIRCCWKKRKPGVNPSSFCSRQPRAAVLRSARSWNDQRAPVAPDALSCAESRGRAGSRPRSCNHVPASSRRAGCCTPDIRERVGRFTAPILDVPKGAKPFPWPILDVRKPAGKLPAATPGVRAGAPDFPFPVPDIPTGAKLSPEPVSDVSAGARDVV
jgi:hypothetical protein